MRSNAPTIDQSTPDSSLGHLAGERWEFDAEVTRVFRDMLERSIPHYDVMRQTVFETGRAFVRPGTDILDLGCSHGDALEPFLSEYGRLNRYVGVEISEPMLEASRERFREPIEQGWVEIHEADLRDTFPQVNASLTLSVLTLQFIPIEHRQRILYEAHRRTVAGGALILVEKILGSSAALNAMMVSRYHRMKARHGYSQEEIERKRLALEGVLVPMTAHWNEELLRAAGFTQVDCIWRWMNFAAWVAVKDGQGWPRD